MEPRQRLLTKVAVGVLITCLFIQGQALAQGTWTTMAPMQTPRVAAASGVVNGILYVAGGVYGCCDLSSVEAYDPSNNTWSYKAPMPAPVQVLQPGQAGVLNGMLYIVGWLQ